MDEVDRRLLNLLQEAFPLQADPYAELGERLGIGAEEALARVARLKAAGVIRRIGAIYDLKRLGFASTLCAARVPEAQVADFVAAVNACPGVTHNYRRDGDYNVWFTLIAPGEAALEETLAGIRRATGIEEILSLKATRTFKINARFDV